jgi:hypothetical protein
MIFLLIPIIHLPFVKGIEASTQGLAAVISPPKNTAGIASNGWVRIICSMLLKKELSIATMLVWNPLRYAALFLPDAEPAGL